MGGTQSSRRGTGTLAVGHHFWRNPRPKPNQTLSFVHITFDMLRFIINDTHCEAPQATIHSAFKATINGIHVTEVTGESQGLRVWDQTPSGLRKKC